MSFDVVARKPAAVLLAALGLLALSGCPDVETPEMESDLGPGIPLPGTTEGDSEGIPPDDPDAGSSTDTGDSSDGPPVDPDAGSSSSGEPSDDHGPPSCNEESFQLTVEPPQVVLLLDKSYSMIEFSWDHDGDPLTPAVTRWNSLHHVVDALAHDVEDEMELGMVLFPSPSVTDNDTSTACLVDPEPGAPVAPTTPTRSWARCRSPTPPISTAARRPAAACRWCSTTSRPSPTAARRRWCS